MFPIRDHNPSGRTPYVTWALIAANVLIFLALLPDYSDPRALWAVWRDWAMIPARLSAGEGWYTLLSSMFLHGGFMHILGNMLLLFIFGDNIEDQFGHVPYLLFYLGAGAVAALAQYAADPHSMSPMVGASGAIAGVLGAYLVLFPRARVDVLIFLVVFVRLLSLPAWIILGFWFAIQIVQGAATLGAQGGVAYLAHAGGFVAGLAVAGLYLMAHGGTGFWARSAGRPPHPQASYRLRRTTIPRISRR